VFSEALASYVKQVLPSLGLDGVKVMDYAQWVEYAVAQSIDRVDRRRVNETPAEVSAMKKHPAMLTAIERQLARRRHATQQAFGDIQIDHDKPLAHAIRDVARKHPHLELIAKRHFEKISDILAEWEELITDEELLRDIPDLQVAMRWTRKQIESPDTYDGVDADRRTAMDNRSIDDDDPIYALDPHDGPLLLNLYEARFGSRLHYDHIAVDEAQDLSPVELKPLLTSLQENRSMTLAGDVSQKVIFDNGFEDWATLLKDIGASGIQVAPFQISYRSTTQIMDFAQSVLGPLKPDVPPKAIRNGAPVDIFEFDEAGEEIAFLAEHLRNLMAREREANVAILTRYPERADFYYQQLKKAEVPFLRRAQKSTFAFAPGIDVTHIAEAKGLEFDYVIVPQVTRSMYPDQVESRHLLHIASTRAAYQLWLTTTTKDQSPLICTKK
jgi:DNA helicase-2/ATP-dependent DNA helicase PcrA